MSSQTCNRDTPYQRTYRKATQRHTKSDRSLSWVSRWGSRIEHRGNKTRARGYRKNTTRIELIYLIIEPMQIYIKPLSVNEVRQWRRYKTKSYKDYEKKLINMLQDVRFDLETKRPIGIVIEYGFHTSQSDIDNPTKPLLDILQKRYGFDDSRIYQKVETKMTVWLKWEPYIYLAFFDKIKTRTEVLAFFQCLTEQMSNWNIVKISDKSSKKRDKRPRLI